MSTNRKPDSKYSHIPETPEAAPAISDARIAFDRAHGKISGMLAHVHAGNPASLTQMQADLDTTLETYEALSLQEKQGVANVVIRMIDDAAHFDIKPSSKPRIAAPAAHRPSAAPAPAVN